LKKRTQFSEGAERSWRILRFSFYKCKNFKWFSLLVDAGRFSRFGDEVLRFAPRKLLAENDEAEEGRGLISWAGDGDGRIGFLFASSLARRVKCFGLFPESRG
jgi:hypothetical protein